MQKIFIFILFCFSAIANAQKVRVSGTVVDQEGKAIPNVSVRELDNNRRVINQTKTDKNGIYSFKVRDNYNYIQFLASGYRKLTHKILGHTTVKATMEARRMSPYAKDARIILHSEKLLCGQYLGESIPISSWIEQLNDTLFSIIVPIETDTEIDEYPIGRQLIVLTGFDQPTFHWQNIVDAYPVLGNWEDADGMRLTQTYDGIGEIPGKSERNRKLYVYPHFQFTLSELQKLIEKSDEVTRFVIDTYNADNYWNFYPTMNTTEELKKIIENRIIGN